MIHPSIPQGDNRRYQAGRGYPLKFQKTKRRLMENLSLWSIRDKEDSKGCDCGSSDRDTDGVVE